MKRRTTPRALLAAAALSAAAISFAAEPESPNLLRNPGFEDIHAKSTAPKQWRANDWSAKAQRRAVTLTAESQDVAEGQAAARVTYKGKGANLVLMQDVPRKGPGGYVLALKCKPAKGKTAYVSAVCFQKNKIVLYPNSARKNGNGKWQDLTLPLVAPAETQYIRILLRCNGNALFDAASLRSIPEAEAKKLMADAKVRAEPSNARELKTWSAKVSPKVLEADKVRKAKMSPEELAWEKVLEQNLGSFYLPRYKEAKAKGGTTAWDYVKDDPKLPRVLLIGDSISRGYTVAVRKALAGKVNVHRAPANCGPTTAGLRKLPVWLGDGKWDLIHFNFGIHDGRSQPEDYAKRLEQVVVKLEATGAKLLWASTTPLAGKRVADTGVDPMVAFNAAAAQVMAKHGIPTDDLHAVATPLVPTMQGADGCHFKGQGYDVIGKAVAKRIAEELGLK